MRIWGEDLDKNASKFRLVYRCDAPGVTVPVAAIAVLAHQPQSNSDSNTIRAAAGAGVKSSSCKHFGNPDCAGS